MKEMKIKLITLSLFCSLIVNACSIGNDKTMENIDNRTEKILVINKYLSTMIEINKGDNVEEIIEERGKNIISSTLNEMFVDKNVVYSITDNENQILRLLCILDEEITKYDFERNYDYDKDYEEHLSIKAREKLRINVFQLAYGFEKHEEESKKTYMELYKKKLLSTDLSEKDIFDYTLIRTYFSFWDTSKTGWSEEYDRFLENLLDAQNKSYLKKFIGYMSYNHLNPLDGQKVPGDVEILLDIPPHDTKTILLPEWYTDISVRKIPKLGHLKMIITEEKNMLNYTIYNEDNDSNLYRMIIPSNNFELKKTTEMSLKRKKNEVK